MFSLWRSIKQVLLFAAFPNPLLNFILSFSEFTAIFVFVCIVYNTNTDQQGSAKDLSCPAPRTPSPPCVHEQKINQIAKPKAQEIIWGLLSLSSVLQLPSQRKQAAGEIQQPRNGDGFARTGPGESNQCCHPQIKETLTVLKRLKCNPYVTYCEMTRKKRPFAEVVLSSVS